MTVKNPNIDKVLEAALSATDLPDTHPVPFIAGTVENMRGTCLVFSREAWKRVPQAVRASLIEGDWPE